MLSTATFKSISPSRFQRRRADRSQPKFSRESTSCTKMASLTGISNQAYVIRSHTNDGPTLTSSKQNILVFSPSPSWWVKIADFGISKRLEGSTVLRTAQVGTRGYTAPELHGLFCPDDPETTADFSYTIAVDVWAIGEIVFRMLTNQPSFPEPRQLFNYVVQGQPFPTGLLDAVGSSPQCTDCIRLMMTASPAARMTAAAALQHAWLKGHQVPDISDRSSTHR